MCRTRKRRAGSSFLTKYSAVWLYPLSYACFLLIPLELSRVMLKIPGLRKLVT